MPINCREKYKYEQLIEDCTGLNSTKGVQNDFVIVDLTLLRNLVDFYLNTVTDLLNAFVVRVLHKIFLDFTSW